MSYQDFSMTIFIFNDNGYIWIFTDEIPNGIMLNLNCVWMFYEKNNINFIIIIGNESYNK